MEICEIAISRVDFCKLFKVGYLRVRIMEEYKMYFFQEGSFTEKMLEFFVVKILGPREEII